MTLAELLGHIKDEAWDWPEHDYCWLASESGIYRTEPDGSEVSIFFIHGGRVRHQAHIPYGYYSLEEFAARIAKLSHGLDEPRVNWVSDSGGGNASFWIEGTRLPNQEDVNRLEAARARQRHSDEIALRDIQARSSAKSPP